MDHTNDLIREIQEHTAAHGVEDTATHLLVQAAAALQRQADELASIGAGGVSGSLLGQPQGMPDLSQLIERGTRAWAGVDAQALREWAAPQAAPAVPDDPLDWPLPCDIKAGGVTIGKGCPLRTVQTRLQVQSEGAALLFKKIRELSPQPEAAAVPAQEPWGYARRLGRWSFCSKRDYEEAMQEGDEVAKLYTAPQPEAQAVPAVPLDSLALMKVVMQADEALVGRCTRGTTNWAAAIGKAVQDAVMAAAPLAAPAVPDAMRKLAASQEPLGAEFEAVLNTHRSELYAEAAPQPEAAPQMLIARSLAEWHEEDGYVAWWAWNGREWAGEPAWIGSPNCDDWPGYHTHWTPHPAQPASAALTAKGEK